MRVLIIDNYDSFTFNLYQYFGEICGQKPLVITNDSPDVPDESLYDAIVISPGPGSADIENDFGLSKEYISRSNKPVLGICLGHQGIVYSENGVVSHAPLPMHGRPDEVVHYGHSQFEDIPESFQVIRYHSLTAQEPFPSDLEITARTTSGLIMACAHRSKPIWGIQFHPESINTEFGKQILRNFVKMSESFNKKLGINSIDSDSVVEKPNDLTGPTSKRSWICKTRIYNNYIDPKVIFDTIYSKSSDDGAFLLDSSESGERGHFHIIGDASGPNGYTVSYNVDGDLIVNTSDSKELYVDGDIYQFLREKLNVEVLGGSNLPCGFKGGFVGYFGYELKSLSDKVKNTHSSNLPNCELCFTDLFIVIDKKQKRTFLVGLYDPDVENSERDIDLSIEKLSSKIDDIIECQDSVTEPENFVRDKILHNNVEFTLEQDQETYLNRINKSLDYIRDGETYEVCLTNRIRTRIEVSPWDLYQTLRKVNPAPYSAFLDFEGCKVLSSSPECFIKVTPNGVVEAKPIKGTRPRSPNPILDRALSSDLSRNEKDRAENLMITDLLRNDLGRVCELGSIWVPKLMDVESYETVHQLVSTIRGQLGGDSNAVDLLEAAFPGGSMTGAPKKRTMEIIDELEDSARGVYSGSVGYLSLNGSADLNIVIRSVVLSEDDTTLVNQSSSQFKSYTAEIGVGGAIIALSDPMVEFAETLVKAEAVMKSIALCVCGDVGSYSVKNNSGEFVDVKKLKETFFFDNDSFVKNAN